MTIKALKTRIRNLWLRGTINSDSYKNEMWDAICNISYWCIEAWIGKPFAFESFMGRGTVAGVALADGAQSSCEEGQPCQLLLWAPLLEVSRATVSMACRKDPFQPLSCFNLKPVPDLLKHFSKSTLGPGSSFHMPQGFHIKTWEMAHKYIFTINHSHYLFP